MTDSMVSPDGMGDRGVFTKGTNLLLTAACVVILVAGLREAVDLLVPMLLAGFVALLCMPAVKRLERLGIPNGLGIPMVIVGVALVGFAVIYFVGASIEQFAAALPDYTAAGKAFYEETLLRDGKLFGQFPVSQEKLDRLEGLAQIENLLDLITAAGQQVLAALSNLFVILLLVVFMLAEAMGIGEKIHRSSSHPDQVMCEARLIKKRISGYVTIKTWVSLLTGGLVTALTAICGVDFPLLWGFLAFVFNFVPNIGSIIAAIPALLVALIDPGPGTALAVGIGYLLINTLVGNLIEPRLMGKKLGLSTLVVFLSLLFWSWMWGAIGMLLSVPLTVVVKIALEHVEDFRPIAVWLGPVDDSSTEKCLVE